MHIELGGRRAGKIDAEKLTDYNDISISPKWRLSDFAFLVTICTDMLASLHGGAAHEQATSTLGRYYYSFTLSSK